MNRQTRDFKARLDRVKEALRVSEVVGHYVPLKRQGSDQVGLCPFHAERTPSFAAVDGKGFYHCHGCGAHGDVVDFIVKRDGVTVLEAVARLEDLAGIAAGTPIGAKRSACAPAAPRGPDPRDAARRRELAADIWRAAQPIAGTPAEAYLRGRGLTLELPPTLRFHPACRHGLSGRTFPALIAAVQGRDRALVGVWRIYLGRSGEAWGKAAVDKAKLGLGIAAGGAVRLGPAAARIATCEGVETGLAIAQACPGLTVWPALSTSGLVTLALPDEVREVVICADNDAPRRAPSGWVKRPGQDAAETAAARLEGEGRRVRIAVPPDEDTDWNDVLRRAA